METNKPTAPFVIEDWLHGMRYLKECMRDLKNYDPSYIYTTDEGDDYVYITEEVDKLLRVIEGVTEIAASLIQDAETYLKPQSESFSIGTGLKFDQSKPRMELLDPAWLLEVARVMTFGASKYSANNWRGGIAYTRLIGAALRHITAIMSGEDHDPETKLLHAAHASCCMMFLTAFQLSGDNSFDDRHKPQA